MHVRLASVLVALASVTVPACNLGGPGKPSRDEAQSLLRQEAEKFAKDGEQVDPILRVKSRWNIEGVDVQEQDDKNRPYRGTIRYKIITTMQDADGSVTNDQLDKQFNYAYDAVQKRWLILPGSGPAAPVRR